MRCSSPWVALAVGFGLAVAAHGAEPTPPPAPVLELRTDPLTELIWAVRRLAADPTLPVPAGWEPAVAAARELDKVLGGALSWGVFSAFASPAEDAAVAATRFAELPDPFRRRSGAEIHLRGPALAFLQALSPLESDFRQRQWPARKARLEAVAAELERDLLARQETWLPFALQHLGVPRTAAPVPVVLVSEHPWPGAETVFTRQGPLCIVSIAVAPDTQLWETVMHEFFHTLDNPSEPTTTSGALAAALRNQGVAPGNRLFHDLGHRLIFTQAAETTRRTLAPQHRDYQDNGYRDETSALFRALWRAHLNGTLSRDAALAEIVRQALVLPPPPSR